MFFFFFFKIVVRNELNMSTTQELKIFDDKTNIVKLVVQKTSGSLKNTAKIKELKKEVARLLTKENCGSK